MKSIVVATIAGLLAGVLGAWLMVQPLDRAMTRVDELEAARVADFSVILTRDAANVCHSSTTPIGQARRGQNLAWNVHDTGRCLGAGAQLELRFKNEAMDPLEQRRPRHNRRIVARVKRTTELGSYPYAVWLIVGGGAETQLEDPELDIVP
jgi:hypothetical protein